MSLEKEMKKTNKLLGILIKSTDKANKTIRMVNIVNICTILVNIATLITVYLAIRMLLMAIGGIQ
jgi:hypothetical protein